VCGVAVWPSVQQCCAAAAYACTNALSAPSSSDFWKPGTRTEHRTRARRAYRIRSGGRPRPSPSSQKPELTEEKGRWSAPPALLGCDSVGTRDPAPAICCKTEGAAETIRLRLLHHDVTPGARPFANATGLAKIRWMCIISSRLYLLDQRSIVQNCVWNLYILGISRGFLM
jgi:hypothetical protein